MILAYKPQTFYFVTFVACLISFSLQGQNSLMLGLTEYEEFVRRKNISNPEVKSSFVLRPINDYHLDSLIIQENGLQGLSLTPKKWLELEVLPIQIRNYYTQKHPYGWNDGEMIPSSGNQLAFRGGFHAIIGPLEMQLYPSYVYAENKDFDGVPIDQQKVLWQRYYRYVLNHIDQPEKFGNGPFKEAFLGQSYAKLNIGPIAFGVSTENLWWGPGRFNALVMSNNAPGFAHFTLNTIKPISTFLGDFEFQLIGGRLEHSGFPPPGENLVYNGSFLYIRKKEDWRYLSGIAFTYQPKWIPGLYLGATRVVQQYGERAKEENDYLGAVSNLWRKNDPGGVVSEINRDQLASLFVRSVWSKLEAEVYFEFARNDASENFRDFFLEPWHSAAFILGFQKLLPFKQRNEERIQLGFEMTSLQQTANRIIREAGSFYVHSRVRHGYTHKGQVMGAGIGPGSNLQTLEINWVRNISKIGLTLERYVHNNDYYYFAFRDTQDPRRHWIDISAFANLQWDFGSLLLSGRIGVIQSLNYQYKIENQITTPTFFVPGIDVINFQANFNLIYRFK